MSFFNKITAVFVFVAMLAPMAPLEAKTKKGDKFFADGRIAEAKKDWDVALEDYEKALAEDPEEVLYQMAADKARFHAGESHVDKGLTLREKGQLGESLMEFQKAYAINPGSAIASQLIQETQTMILRERKRVEQTGQEAAPDVRALTPSQVAEQQENDRIDRMLPIPQLRQLKPGLVDLKMIGKVKTIYETLGKLNNPPINVLWDPDYQNPTHDNFTVDFEGSTLEQAFDYISVLSKSYWKALSPNTIFITNDNQTKRRDYEEQVLKTIYLHNVGGQQEFNEVVNAVRTVPELTKVFPDASQYAIVLKGEADKVALAEKIAHDLDKPRPEVLFDILVMEASSVFSKQITAAIASTGLNVPVNFTPRSSIQVQSNSTATSTSTTSATTSTSTTTSGSVTSSPTTGSSTTGAFVPLSSLGHLSSSDFSTTLPSALLQAAMSDAKTRVLQAPEMRCMDNIKAVINIGEREPTASGSFQPGIGGVGINPLVNTQFQYIDIGVNIEALARVHSATEVSVHMLLNITSVTGQVNLGGINQPIIGQRKIEHDLRIREGEVALLGGLVTRQDDKSVTGIPGLSAIPFLGTLFKGQSVDHNRDDIVIAIIPHIIRKPEFTEENLRAIAVGAAAIKINYGPAGADNAPAPPPPGHGAVAPPLGGSAAGAPPATAPALTGAISPTPPATAAAPPGGPPATAPPAAPPATALPATAPPINTQTAGSGALALRFNPQTVETNSGGTFSVSIMADNAADVANAPVQLTFDPKMLRLNDVVAGDLLARGTGAPLLTKNIQNEAGRASIQVGRQPGATGVTGSGAILTLTFSAVSAGQTQIVAPNIALRNSQGQPAGTGSPVLNVRVK